MFISKWTMQINSCLLIKPGVLVPLWLLCATAAAQDRFTLGVGVQEYWDSNFARNPDVDSEHYTLAAISLAANQKFSKQQLALGLRGNRYSYAEREDLDAEFYEGNASWRSDWNTRLKTALTWNRDAYPVDQLEFSDKDVVARDDTKAQVTLGTSNRVSITAGASRAVQTHSNSLRQSLEFDEDEVFIAASYQTSNETSLGIRLRDGERIYPYPDPNEPLTLDFDYQQRELEGSWAPTAKTRLSATIGQFEREGEVNAGVGTQSLVDASWKVSEKLELSLGYTHSEPAVGETTDSPSDVRAGHLKLVWEPGSKWVISMEGRYAEQEYLQRGLEPARDETITSISPLVLTYRFSEGLAIRIDSQWVDRKSPLLYRDYDYALASLGLGLKF